MPLAAGVLVVLLAGTLLATRLVAVPWRVSGPSMEPTLRPGDRVIVDLWTFRQRAPRPGEVALLLGPGDVAMIKRVHRRPAPPGRSAAVDPAAPFRDLPRPSEPPPASGPPSLFVEGDNPRASLDSREFGPVSTHRFRGRVVWRYWPPSRIGPVR